MSNYYASPADDDDLPQSPEMQRKAKVRRVANRHRIILLLWAANVLIVVVLGLVWGGILIVDDPFEQYAAMGVIAMIAAAGGTLAWLVGGEILSRPLTIALTILSAVPGAAIIGLAWLSILANRYLMSEGIRVGVLGADPGQIH